MIRGLGRRHNKRDEANDSMGTPGRISIPSQEQIQAELDNIKHRNAYKKALISTVYALIVVAALAVLVATLFLPVLQITGTSMEPTLEDGDIIVLIKTGRIENGELCGFSYQNKILIKRIIGIPGDFIEIDSDGTVYVNGEMLEEPYVTEKSLGECDIEFPYQVPEGRYFVLGDHRSTSIDSRSSIIGCIDEEQIVGRILMKVWPFSQISII